MRSRSNDVAQGDALVAAIVSLAAARSDASFPNRRPNPTLCSGSICSLDDLRVCLGRRFPSDRYEVCSGSRLAKTIESHDRLPNRRDRWDGREKSFGAVRSKPTAGAFRWRSARLSSGFLLRVRR